MPAASVGLSAFEIQTYSFIRPRFAPQIHFEGKTFNNNGWGNGDQDAAGNSLCNSNAENAEWNLSDDTTREECLDNIDGNENQSGGKSKKSSGA